MILVTGSAGLIGSGIVKALRADGLEVREFDFAANSAQDVRDTAALQEALEGVSGIVHLAAVSRVVWAERDPKLTEAVNVTPLLQIARHIRSLAAAGGRPPWLVFASSREVYGECAQLPVREESGCSPRNVYARSKVAGEELVASIGSEGFIANVCRFSNVYGSTADHVDRVVPAFARAAATGGSIRIEGPDCVFDFTHVDDVVRGLNLAIRMTAAGERFDPVHFVTGRPCSLRELADLAHAYAHAPVAFLIAPARTYDVARFYGDPARAHRLLGWRAEIQIEQGMPRLIDDFRDGPAALPAADLSGTVATGFGQRVSGRG